MTEHLIKNKNKYRKIKLAKGLNLQNFETKQREGKTGISSKTFGKVWFITPKGEALFKTYDGNASNIRVINEMLYYALAKQVGVNAAEYEPAHNNKKVGLVTYNIVKPEYELVSIQDLFGKIIYNLSYKSIIDHFRFMQSGTNTDIDKLSFELFKMMVLDDLTFQEDRHNNLNFLYNRETKTYELAPVIDNELCFGGSTMAFAFDANEKLYKNGFLFDHGLKKHFFCNDETICSNAENVYKTDIKQIVALSKTRPTFEVFLYQTIKKLDIDKAINEVEQKGYVISKNYKQYLREIIHISKQAFLNEMYKKEKQENNEYNCTDIHTTW